MTIEWLLVGVLFCSFAGLTLAFRQADGRPFRIRGARPIRWDAPTGR